MLWPRRPALSRLLFILTTLIPLVLQAPAFADPAPTRYPAMLLHIGSPTGKNPCAAGTVPAEDVVTSAPAAPDGSKSYFVYILARNGWPDTTNTLAGLEVGIQYDAPGPGQGIKVNDWHSCGDLEFPMAGWPQSGKGNLVTWEYVDHCQTGELAVAGYFYLTAYSPATMSLTPRPASGTATVANCGSPDAPPEDRNAMESPVYPGRLGWVSFGGGERHGDTDGFNPVTEPLFQTSPYAVLYVNSPADSIDDDDLPVSWYAIDDVPDSLDFFYRLDGGPWGVAAPYSFPRFPDYRNYSVMLYDLAKGQHHFELQCRDPDGETTTASIDFTTLRDPNHPPETFLTSGPAEGDTVSTPVTFSWSATDDRTPPSQLFYFYYLDDPQEQMGNPDSLNKLTSMTYNGLAPGPHRFSVRAIDTEHEGDRTPVVRNFFVIGTGTTEPVTLLSFFSEDGAARVILHWKFALDSPVTCQVQRTPDLGTPFQPVSDLIHLSAPGEITWQDPYPSTSAVYYRLAWMEREGWSYSTPLRVVPPPARFAIRTIEPNPSRGATSIEVTLDQRMDIQVEIFDVGGRRVRLFRLGDMDAGRQTFSWSGDSDGGGPVPSGVYFVRLKGGDRSVSRRFVLMR